MFKALIKFFKLSKSFKFLKDSKVKPSQIIIHEYSYDQNDAILSILVTQKFFWTCLALSDVNWYISTNMSRLVTILWYNLIQFYKSQTCLDLSKAIRWWNILIFEQMADEIGNVETKWFLGSLRASRAIKKCHFFSCPNCGENVPNCNIRYQIARTFLWLLSCTFDLAYSPQNSATLMLK